MGRRDITTQALYFMVFYVSILAVWGIATNYMLETRRDRRMFDSMNRWRRFHELGAPITAVSAGVLIGYVSRVEVGLTDFSDICALLLSIVIPACLSVAAMFVEVVDRVRGEGVFSELTSTRTGGATLSSFLLLLVAEGLVHALPL